MESLHWTIRMLIILTHTIESENGSSGWDIDKQLVAHFKRGTVSFGSNYKGNSENVVPCHLLLSTPQLYAIYKRTES